MKEDRSKRFAFDPVTPEEAGTVKDALGCELIPSDPGFLEALARKKGFELVIEGEMIRPKE